MADLMQISNDVEVPVGLFLNIKFFATGDIPEKVNLPSALIQFLIKYLLGVPLFERWWCRAIELLF